MVKRGMGGSSEGLFHIFSSTLSPTLRSEPPRPKFSAEGYGKIKLTAHLDPMRSFYSMAHLGTFISSQQAGEWLIRELTEEL